MKMGLIVQKFGGTSVADTERLRNVARIITDTYKAGNQVVVVLSAQGDTTDDLIEKAGWWIFPYYIVLRIIVAKFFDIMPDSFLLFFQLCQHF